jgi:hypothetical protein
MDVEIQTWKLDLQPAWRTLVDERLAAPARGWHSD